MNGCCGPAWCMAASTWPGCWSRRKGSCVRSRAGSQLISALERPDKTSTPKWELLMRLANKVVLVTGGNSGIGRGIVRRAAQEGARVGFVGRDAGKGADTLGEMKSLGAD